MVFILSLFNTYIAFTLSFHFILCHGGYGKLLKDFQLSVYEVKYFGLTETSSIVFLFVGLIISYITEGSLG